MKKVSPRAPFQKLSTVEGAKGRFVFCGDCRVAQCASRNDKGSAQCIVHSAQLRIKDYAHKVGDFSTALEMTYMRIRNDRTLRGGAFVCLVEIAASRFALLARSKAVHSVQCTVHSFGRGRLRLERSCVW
ncbi:MAG: hypothetical protein LBL66_01495 [Clostridiales bacterium]|nr:hypothetical protein [Clostridiales bacterium]